MKLPTIAHDKALHGIYGFAAFMVAYIAALLAGVSGPLSTMAGFLAVAIVGVGREVWQEVAGKGTPDMDDAWATGIGGLVAALTVRVGYMAAMVSA